MDSKQHAVWSMHGLCMDVEGVLDEVWMNFVWILLGCCSDPDRLFMVSACILNDSGWFCMVCIDYAWTQQAFYIVVAWIVQGCCNDSAWIMCTCRWGYAWVVHGLCMDCGEQIA